MNKNQYIAPAIEVSAIVLESQLMQNSVSSVSGLDGVMSSSTEFAGGAVDAKRSFNVWDDDWSKDE